MKTVLYATCKMVLVIPVAFLFMFASVQLDGNFVYLAPNHAIADGGGDADSGESDSEIEETKSKPRFRPRSAGNQRDIARLQQVINDARQQVDRIEGAMDQLNTEFETYMGMVNIGLFEPSHRMVTEFAASAIVLQREIARLRKLIKKTQTGKIRALLNRN